MFSRIHPDKLSSAGASPEVVKAGQALSPLVDKILKSQVDMERWGDDIDQSITSGGPEIALVGLAPDGTIRPPRVVNIRKPAVFLEMLAAYLNEGSIPEELFATPAYDPSEVDEYEEEFMGSSHPDAAGRESARQLKEGIQNAKDFDHCMGLKLATQISSQHNMRLYGVLQALDKKVGEIITTEIVTADSREKIQLAEEHLKTFQFDDATIADRLQTMFNERLQEGAAWPSTFREPNEFEAELTDAVSLEDLTRIEGEIRTATFPSERERINTLKNISTLAKKMLMDECNELSSMQQFAETFNKAQRFPFVSDPNASTQYGDDVLDTIETRAKYFVLGQIGGVDSIEKLEAIEDAGLRFPFRHNENITDLRNEFIIVREALRGNAINVEHVNNADLVGQDARRLDELGL